MWFRLLVALATSIAPLQALDAADSYSVSLSNISDDKAVFATVEAPKPVQARVRTGGTVAQLTVREGDRVETGQVIATVGDEKLALQMKSLDAQIAGLQAQLAQAKTDLTRAESLAERGTVPRARLDEARTAVDVAANALQARIAERSVVERQLAEGEVLAPTAGRVLSAPYTAGAVVLPGEVIATIAEQNFVLRLRVPERHAQFLKVGDRVRVDGEEIGLSGTRFGTIRLIYPRIEDGRVVADAVIEGLGDYFVGRRIRVWISGGTRQAFIVPAPLVSTRFGVDYVRVALDGGKSLDVPVQRGRPHPTPEMPDGLEILSGIKAGDRLVRP
ncbi:MAG: efflux RND transporter periplasmic adaptor subunit [Hyphomicrobium sp.]|nr:efflux RND transporter periplasmic adaptor subunit [Hyphomicrobium sp.]